MKFLTAMILSLTLTFGSAQATFGQDYIAYVEQLAAEAGQRAQAAAQNAINIYRQETGDYTTSDQVVYNYLCQMSRQQNPEWYADLQRREAQFQQQQANYTQYANSMLDNSYNAYMQRSNMQHQAHQNYIRQSIWERNMYTGNNGYVYELPYYSGGNMYQSNDGSTFIQDNSGQYYQYDNAGWQYEMQQID